jgi:hypothetical protein
MDNNLYTTDPIALSLLFTDDLYIIDDVEPPIVISKETLPAHLVKQKEPETTAPIKVEAVKQLEEIKLADKPYYQYLGENNKSFLVVIYNETLDYLAKADLEFLLKILKAKNLILDDIAILNKAKYQNLSFENLKAFFGFNKMLTFGINPKEFGIASITANKKYGFKNTEVLGTWDLNQLSTDVKKKAIFWNELKTL